MSSSSKISGKTDENNDEELALFSVIRAYDEECSAIKTDAFGLARQEIQSLRDKGQYEKIAGLRYNEIDCQSFYKLLKEALLLVNSCKESKKDNVFVDFGSGSGKAVLTAACLPDLVKEAIGVELVKPLHHLATTVYKSEQITKSGGRNSMAPVKLYQGDMFLPKYQEFWQRANVLFLHCTVFPDELIQRIHETIDKHSPSSPVIVLTTTRRLDHRHDYATQLRRQYRVVMKTSLKMAKGIMQCYVHRVEEKQEGDCKKKRTTTGAEAEEDIQEPGETIKKQKKGDG